jgi:hypothetical protein
MASPQRVLTVLLVVLACTAGEAEEKKPPKASFLEVGKVRLYRKERRIEITGRIAVQRRAIELFACCEGGKVHETVVVLDCKPSNLNLALLLLGLSDGGQVREKVQVREKDKVVEKEMLVENGPRFFGDPRKPVGDRLIISVRWKALESGKPREVRAEEMVFNVSRQKTMRKVGWIFTGSRWVEHPKTKKKEFAADHTKTIMTTYHDPNTVLENPLETGGNDELYHANSLVVPPRGTALTLILRVPTAEERLEAEKNEAAADRERRDKKGEKGAGGGAPK